MSNVIDQHLQRFPKARTSTLIILQRRAEVTKQLQDEILEEQSRRTPKAWWSPKRWPSWVWRW